MKLFVTDLDGTLYPKNKSMIQLQSNICAIKKWINKGNLFAVATARGVGHYDTLTQKLGFNVNYFGGNGAEIILDNGKIILKSFPIKIFYEICKYLKEKNWDASASTIYNRHWYWSSKENYPIYNSTEPRWKHAEYLEPYSLNESIPIERVAVYMDAKKLNSLKKDLIIQFADTCSITVSDKDTLDFGPFGCSKGTSILEFARTHQIDPRNIIVIGDSENDLSMFKIASRSYCLDHADYDIQSSATHIVSSVEEAILMELETK